MQLRFVDTALAAQETPLLAIPVTEGMVSDLPEHLKELDDRLSGALSHACSSGDMSGRSGDEVVLYGAEGTPARVALLGVGTAGKVDAEGVRRLGGRAVRLAERLRIDRVSIALDGLDAVGAEVRAQAAAEGAGLAAWRFDELKADDEENPTTPVTAVDLVGSEAADAFASGALAGAAIARGANFARTLQM